MSARESIATGSRVRRPYLIVGFQRSGTTMVHLLLAGHPAISVLGGELRRQFYEHGLALFTGGYLNKVETVRHHRALFDTITTIGATPATRYHGAKTVVNSPREARKVVATLCRSFPDMKVVLVRRNDWVAQYGSVVQRARTGVAHSWRRGKDGKPWQPRAAARISINPLLFRLYAMRVHETLQELERLHATHPVHVLDYEDYCRDPDAGYRAMLRFLELPYIEPSWVFSRKVSPPPQTYIRNYAELSALADSVRAGGKPSAPTLFAAKVLWRMQRLSTRFHEGIGRRAGRMILPRVVRPDS